MTKNKLEKQPTDLPSALENFQKITARFGSEDTLLFLDFDGTLAPIVEHHDDAAISEEMRGLVQELSKRFPLAVVSGRGLADVRKRVNLPDLFYAGSHGFEISGPNGFAKDHEEAVKVIPVFDEIEPLLKRKLKEIAGTDFERKKFTMAIHYRQVKQEEQEKVHNIVSAVLNDYSEVTKADGKKVIEIRPAIDWHKGRAVEFLKTVLSKKENQLSVYVGDDVTDEDAFEYVKNGIGILVGEHGRQTYADYRVEDLKEVKLFFQKLLQYKS
ncbi:trehalose-phosphatase [Salinimicrobium sp. GXAS 041]|uniref:trehalose-phosphatase n=1 Tax=Salinimicrobium sp. GXAS 041 TaxID=3400806 RepID=UPI003C7411B3